MIDQETLGTSSNSVVISIGAVPFDPETGDVYEDQAFYQVVNGNSCVDLGLEVDVDTVMWWMKQDTSARSAFSGRGDPIAVVIAQLESWYSGLDSWGKNIPVWGNGSDFDLSILSNIHRKLNKETPWKFWDHRCYRTMKSMVPGVKLVRMGSYHNALDDAVSQAYHLIQIMNKLGVKG